jgi:hypothetical protein
MVGFPGWCLWNCSCISLFLLVVFLLCVSRSIFCLLELVLACLLSHRLLFLDHHSPGTLSAKSTTLSRYYFIMRFPTALFTAVAGLWQHPLVSEEETITNTRHVHVTRFVTNLSSTAYAVRMGTLTLYMEYLPATLTKKSAPWQALQTPHLELRAERISTTHIKVTQTVAETQATIFTSKVRTSVSTITNVPQSLIEEAAEDAAELRPSQVTTAASSVNDDVLTHSTVALLANTGLSPVVESSALPSPTQSGPVQSSNSSASSALTQPTAAIPSSPLPIDLELRSNAETTTNGQLQATTTEIPSTVVVVIFGSSTSTMTPIPPTMPTSTTSSQASSTAVSSTSRQITVSEQSTRTAQSTLAPVAVNTNAAQIKSIQTALIQAPTYSDITVTTSSSASSSPTVQECSGTCSSLASISTAVSSSSPSSASSNKVYTIPVTMTDVTSSAASTVLPSAAQTSDSATIVTSYGAQSSASSAAADIAADNAAGASGGDSSFKLSKGGFAAIISVVSIGVGLGSTSPFHSSMS